MIELQGKYNKAIVFTDNIDSETISQIINLCNQDFTEGCKIRIMPDCHAGVGCVIGFTADLGGKVIPNIVGVDIGCGIITIKLGRLNLDLKILDDTIREHIPSGRDTHTGRMVKFSRLYDLYCFRELKDTKRLERSIGSLGGGNHFIEVAKDSRDELYLLIHSGSRNLGKQVADYYQNVAVDLRSGKGDYFEKKDRLIKEYKKSGKRKEIQPALNKLKLEYDNKHPDYPKDLCFLDGAWMDKYLHDMKICQEYAELNRVTMAEIILDKLLSKKLNDFEHFQTIHNYINFSDNIIRKGSISSYRGEKVIIPVNMRDGSLLAVGKGNPEWNYSAPHGAGRILSRSKAKKVISLDEYKESMEGIYTTSVGLSTIDEAPMAYKNINEIIENTEDTIEVKDILKPIYNFKSAE